MSVHLQIQRSFEWVASLVLKYRPYWVCCLGDVFHIPGVVDTPSLNVAWDGFRTVKQACEESESEMVVIPGNHDIVSDVTKKGLHSIPFLSEHLCDHPSIVEHSIFDLRAGFVPYMKDADLASRYIHDIGRDSTLDFIGCHLDVLGLKLNSGAVSTIGVDPQISSRRGPIIFNGHFHHPEQACRWINVGSWMYRSYHDSISEKPRGAVLFSGGEVSSAQWMENPHTDVYHTIRGGDSVRQINRLLKDYKEICDRLNLKVSLSDDEADLDLGSYRESFLRLRVDRPTRKRLRSGIEGVNASARPEEAYKAYAEAQGLKSFVLQKGLEILALVGAKDRSCFSDIDLLSFEGDDIFSYKHVQFDFSPKSLILVEGKNLDSPGSGSNGSGKSTFATEILFWALTGKTFRGAGLDEVVREGATKATACLSFRRDGVTYKVERSRSIKKAKGTSTLLLFREGEDISSDRMDGAEGTEASIQKAFGLSLSDLKQLVLLDLSSGFMTLTDADKKEFIEGILGCEVYATAEAEAKKLEEKAEEALDRSSRELDHLSSKIEQQMEILEKARQEEASRIASRSSMLSALESEKANLSGQEASLSSSLSTLLQRAKEVQELCDKSERSLSETSSNLRSLERKVHSLESKYEQAIQSLENTQSLLDGKCTLCGQNVPPSPEHEKTISSMEEAASELETAISSERLKLSRLKKLHEDLESHQPSLRASARSAHDNCSSVREKLREVSTSLNAVVRSIDGLKDTESLSTELQQQLDEMLERQAALTLKVNTKEVDLELLGDVRASFGPKGIRSYVVDRCLWGVNKHLGDVLSDFGSSIECSLSPQKELKDKKKGPSQSITAVCSPRSFSTLSRGERARIRIGIQLAFKRYKEESGSRVNYLVVDECDDGLDQDGMEALIHLLSQEKCSTLFVSHQNLVRHLIPDVIVIEKHCGISSVLRRSVPQL